MEEISIKKIENGYLITKAGKTYVATQSSKTLLGIVKKLLKEEKDLPPALPKASPKKVALE